jgi:hypothetical protein
MLGFKDDSVESCQRTVAFAKSLGLDYLSVNIVSPLMGSSVRRELKADRKIEQDRAGFDTFGNRDVVETPRLSKRDLLKLRNGAVRSFYFRPSWLSRRLLAIRSVEELLIHVTEGLGILYRLLTQPSFLRR